MTDAQIYLTLGVFAAVIVAIALDVIDAAVAALLGACILTVFGVVEEDDVILAFRSAGGPLALLFGGMVVARVLAKTGVFERVGQRLLRATGGSGRRFLLLLVLLVASLCAVLPNATTVVLLAPVVIRVAQALGVDFVGPLILTAIVSNSAGMLTLVGDPATFLVGSTIGMSFGDYLRSVSVAGLLAVLAVVPLLPRLLPDVWRLRASVPAPAAAPPIERPGFVALALATLLLMVLLFVFGDALPRRIVPPAVAIIGATLALLVVYGARVEPVDQVLRDVDWRTLTFIAAIFCLVQAFSKTGLLQGAAFQLHAALGDDLARVSLVLLAGIGVLSGVLANIPVVAAALVMTKGYLVAAEVVPELALAPGFSDWPPSVLPVFVAMMFGGTLGGNATMIGASANIVSVGICQAHGRHVSFVRFLRYGLPITAVQLALGAAYVAVLHRLVR